MEQRIAQLTETFDEQDADFVGGDPLGFDGYAEQLERARAETGRAEACAWGWAVIGGVQCALVVMDFAFLGGSMGAAVGEKVARAFDASAKRKLPIVTVTASGGARMQEGMVGLVQMAKTVQARSRHAAAGLAHVTLLTSPTTGGVYASFASLADVMLAEPGATVGFAGPRVATELLGTPPPPEVHTTEFAYEHGLIDELVPPSEQASAIGRALRNLTAKPPPGGFGGAQGRAPQSTTQQELGAATSARSVSPPDLTAWERLQMVRRPDRPKARAILDELLVDAVELRGDRLGSDDPAVVVRIGSLLGGRRVLALGQDSSGDGRIRAPGFRKAIRALRLAPRHRLPVVTLIDTRGADPGAESEAGGIVPAIAWTFVSMLECASPTVAVVTGEGGSGGALAMTPADSVLAWENAVFSVIAPEAAASILYRDPSRGPELAERLGIVAEDLAELRIADEIVPEPAGGAHTAPGEAVRRLGVHIADEVERLVPRRPAARLRARRTRWREAGSDWIRHISP